MSCSSLFPQLARTTDSFLGFLYFGQIFNNVFALNLQHIGEIQMPQPLMPQFTIIYGSLVAKNLRICCETRKAIAIVSSSFSHYKPFATAVKYVTFLLGELHHQIIVTKLADADEIFLEPLHIQVFLRCSETWNVDDSFSNNFGLAPISIGDPSSFAHLNFFQ
jgi:hypothetical protein